MTTIEFLSLIRGLGVKLWVDGERLRYSAPTGALTPTVLKQLAERKAEIISFLRGTGVAARTASQVIPAASRDRDIPLSYAQQRLWILNQLNPLTSVYNMPGAVCLRGALDLSAFEQSFNEIIQRHEILRTNFTVIDGRPSQTISPSREFRMPLVDLRELDETERKTKVQELATVEAQRPFDLATGSLLRAMLLRLRADEHVLLWTMHHIVSDGWSMDVLLREFGILYEAFSKGQPSPLPRLPIQYADFAVWQREWLKGEVMDNQLAYWKQRLGDNLPILELPTDHPRPAVQTFRGAHQSLMFSSPLTAALKELSQREGVTLSMTLLSAFKVLLHRYTGQDDILIGTTIANRNRAETESLIGFFINTLVLRTDLSGNPNFLELLRRVREVTLGAYAHQDLPFEILVEELQPKRDMSRSPLFQVMFDLRNTTGQDKALPGLAISPVVVENWTAKFDLTLNLRENEQGLTASLEYNTDLFDDATIERMLEHFQVLLEGIVANPTQAISSLPLLTEGERHKLLVEWNGGQTEYQRQACLHELFEAQVERTPDAVALVYEDEQLTYRELNRRANQLAHHLRGAGGRAEVLVGLCVERSIEMVVGLLGILKAGGAYLPLDPAYPKERLRWMLEDARVGLLVTQGPLVERLPEHKARVVCMDLDRGKIARESEENPVNETAADNLAYVIYTSGSTGKPKGSLVSHFNVVRLFQATQSSFNFNSSDVWALFHSYGFDFSVWELWGALLYGGRLVGVPYFVSRSPEAFYELLRKEQVTILNQTPSAFRQLMRTEESLNVPHKLDLRLVIFGGEALELQSLKPWFERHGDEHPRLVNMYGITETTVHVTYRPLVANDVRTTLSSLIGGPIPDLQVYLVDQHMQPVPIGVPGEMCVGGAGLARGYLNRPDVTAERFAPNPFDSRPGKRLYKSGDLARYLSNGDIEYLGRIDHQVKVRGFRIELGEIEAVLSQHAAVRESVVLARGDSTDEKRLVAYVVPQGERTATIGELRSFLQDKLPDYMIPSVFITLESIPLTSNGKVDRKALPAPDATRPELEKVYVSPSTHVEEVLAGVWAEVLRLERVGIHDNIFDLGGDSIRTIQIHAKARQRGLDFSIQQIFRHQTIHELAQVVTRTESDSVPAPKTEAFSLISQEDRMKVPEGVEDAYPLAMLQTGMIFHSKYNSDSAVYHNITSLHLEAPFDAEHWQAALRRIAASHSILRTSFDLSNFSEPLQLVHRTVRLPLQIEDVRHLSLAAQEEAIDAWIEAEKTRNFNWTHPPFIRFQIYLRSEDTFQLSWAEHHAILDGWSMASMITELLQCYFLYLGEESRPFQSPPSSTYRDFVALEREALNSEEFRQYWIEKLSGGNVTMIPRWPSSEGEAGNRRKSLEIPISTEISEGLKQLARSVGVPLKSVLLAAHLRVLSLLTGQSDVTTGLVSNGRLEETDGERVLGLFLNTLPFRSRLPEGTWIELIRETFEAEQEMMPFRRYPLAELQRRLGGKQLFETIFNFVNFHVYQNLRDLKIQLLNEKSVAETNFTLEANFSLDLFTSHVHLKLGYDVSKLHTEQIELFGGYYISALKAMVTEPAESYVSDSLLSSHERHKLLVEWNNTQTAYPMQASLGELFEAQVERTPDAVAVVFDDEQLSYRQLNRRANQLAHHLQALGVGPEVLVGICLPRSVTMIVGLLGILKAGGAYVPLDPTYPIERLRFMLEDAQVRVLLTQQHLVQALPEHLAEVVCLDSDWEKIELESATPPVSGVQSSNLAYVIYTSGSTGRPKGVMIQHGSALNLRAALHERIYWQQPPQLKVSVNAPLAFDSSVKQLLQLLSGHTLHIIPEELRLDAPRLLSSLAHNRLDVLDCTPSQLKLLLAAGLLTGEGHHLKLLLVGGEAIDQGSWEELAEQRATRCYNVYGPTECTVDATVGEVWTSAERPSIGRPLANTQVYLLDRQLRPVPIGVPAQMYIGGAGVSRGYLQRPEVTAEQFIPHPFSREPGARLYRTGDVARHLPGGEMEFLGRVDEQVKIRGFRIELGEVEAALKEHAQVQDSVVMAGVGAGGEQRLVAYVILREEVGVSTTELRSFLKLRLPSHMLPSAFVLLDAWPLTASGKVDRRRLPAPEQTRPELTESYVAPRDTLELQLTQIWEDTLDIRPIGVTDNFFDLGGNSILAVRLMAQIQKQFGQDLPINTLFNGASVERLSDIVRGQSGRLLQSSLIGIQRAGSKRPFFCVHPVGGNVFCYFELSRRLGPDQPFYGLQAQGLHGDQQPLKRIEDMAAHYIKAIRSLPPHGPYLLGGWSLGGAVAFEMAQQLQRQGEEVALLVLIDSRSPVPVKTHQDCEEEDDSSLLARFLMDLGGTSGKDLSILLNDLRPLKAEEQVSYILKQASRHNIVSPQTDASQIRRLLKVFKSNRQALRTYVPQSYPGRIILFRADAVNDGTLNDSSLGWAGFAEQLEIHSVPGDHYSMIANPHVQVLAEQIKAHIDEAEATILLSRDASEGSLMAAGH